MLVALFEEGGEARVVLTVRSDRLRSHRGEVAFPGGRLDAGEAVVEAALREAFEEVGLDPAPVTVVGAADRHAHRLVELPDDPGGGHPGRPRPTCRPRPTRWSGSSTWPCSELVADGVFHEEWWSVPGRPGADGRSGGEFPVWFFEVAGETVWGATARVLVELRLPRWPWRLPGPLAPAGTARA